MNFAPRLSPRSNQARRRSPASFASDGNRRCSRMKTDRLLRARRLRVPVNSDTSVSVIMPLYERPASLSLRRKFRRAPLDHFGSIRSTLGTRDHPESITMVIKSSESSRSLSLSLFLALTSSSDFKNGRYSLVITRGISSRETRQRLKRSNYSSVSLLLRCRSSASEAQKKLVD